MTQYRMNKYLFFLRTNLVETLHGSSDVVQNLPQLRLGARLDGTVAHWHAGSSAEVGEEVRDGGSRAVVQDVLCGHRRCRRVGWKLVWKSMSGVWVVTVEAMVEWGGLRAVGSGVVRRLEAVALQVQERCSRVEVPKASVVRRDGGLVQIRQAVVEVGVGTSRVVLEAGEAGVVTQAMVGEEVGEAGVEVGRGRRVLEGRVGRDREGAVCWPGARARVEVRPRWSGMGEHRCRVALLPSHV